MQVTHYALGSEGPSKFLHLVADNFTEISNQFADSEQLKLDSHYFMRIPALQQSRVPMAFGAVETAGAVVIFIGTCFAKKIFDEVYERTLKRPIGTYLDSIFKTGKLAKDAKIEHREIIHFEDIDLTVVIRAFVDEQTTLTIEQQILRTHQVVHEYIERNGRKAPIHCYEIRDGALGLDPLLFQSLQDLKQNDAMKTKLIVHKMLSERK